MRGAKTAGNPEEMTTAELQQKSYDHLWLGTQQSFDSTTKDSMKVFVRGDGCRLTDSEGNSYIDGMSGLWVMAVGHGRKELAEVALAQMQNLAFVSPFLFPTPPAVALASKLAEITPGSLSRVLFCSGGSEAVEAALKIAKQYHFQAGNPSKFKVISRKGSYHGCTAGALSVASSAVFKRHLFEPLQPSGRFVSPPYCYRCDFGMEYPSCDLQCVKSIEQLIEFENPETISAIITDPVSMSCGVVVPPPEYMPMVRKICDKYDILLIADEVINGFGRTGKMFACEHWDIVPDIITLAKAISSGYIPLGATVVRAEIAQKFTGGRQNALAHGNTFGGHPVACAVGLANIDIIERENLVENSAEMGNHLLDGLRAAVYESPMVGDVRGLGLLCGIELVKDTKTKEKFPPSANLDSKLQSKLAELGMIGRAGNMMFIAPPLIVTKGEVEEIVDIVQKSIRWLEQETAKGNM